MGAALASRSSDDTDRRWAFTVDSVIPSFCRNLPIPKCLGRYLCDFDLT